MTSEIPELTMKVLDALQFKFEFKHQFPLASPSLFQKLLQLLLSVWFSL